MLTNYKIEDTFELYNLTVALVSDVLSDGSKSHGIRFTISGNHSTIPCADETEATGKFTSLYKIIRGEDADNA